MLEENKCDQVTRLVAYNGDIVAQYNIAKYHETIEIDIDQSFGIENQPCKDTTLQSKNAMN